MSVMKYTKARVASSKKGEHNDCAVVALSIAGRVPYNVAHKELSEQGRKSRHCTHTFMTIKAAIRLGMKVEHSQPRQKTGSMYTPKTIGKVLKRGYYMCRSRGHIFAVVNGEVLDWSEGRQNRIIEVWKVTKPRNQREAEH